MTTPPTRPAAALLAAALPLAAPVGRLTAAIAAGILAVGCLAGALRVLPVLVAPGAPGALVPALARGVLGMALETALFVAPPLAAALAVARLVDRGEARALFAVGVRPARLLATAWPAAVGIALISALAVASWGSQAAAPGRLVREMVAAARSACAAEAAGPGAGGGPAAVEVPLLGIAGVCFPGAPPRAVGTAPGGDRSPAFVASAIAITDDLRSLDAEDLSITLPPAIPGGAGARLRASRASLRGLVPVGRASNLAPAVRVAVLTGSTLALAALAGALVLLGSVGNRPAALALGAAGPVAALLVFSALERGPASPLAYAAVPAAGLAAASIAAMAPRAAAFFRRAPRALLARRSRRSLPRPGGGGTG